ncbi:MULTISPECIES: hypothetical protein [unclassified Brachybacterium]|uniref:hypothetical protein n=1 Tax=unclassified Brachybacterium TaxID=2623841 RepID=UPI0011AF6B5C|nr:MULTISPECIES: hypothetical protein [unclassified Brachybacterium]
MTTLASGEVRGATIEDKPDKIVDPAPLSDRLPPAAGPFWTVTAVVSVAVLLAVNVTVSRTAVAPRTPWDEIVPLQMARELAGQGPVSQMSGAGYFPGWAILLTPIWWFTQDPAAVYTASIGVVIALAMVTVLPLMQIARLLGLPTAQAVTAAALTLSVPARTVNADYVLAENLLALLVACSALAAFRLWQRPSPLTLFLFILAVTAAYLTHARALAVVLAAAVWLLLFALRDWRVTVGGAALLVGGYWLVKLLVAEITIPILLSGFGQGELLGDKLENLAPGPFLRVAFAQAWGQFAGSFGVTALGLVVLAFFVWRELRTLRVGPYGFMAGLLFVASAVSVIAWSNAGPQERFDAQVYTRYIDPFAVLAMLLGVVALLRTVRRPLLLAAVGLVLADTAVVLFKVAPWANTWGTMYGPANSAAILAWAPLRPSDPFPHPLIPAPGNANELWFWASLCLVSGVLVMLAVRTRPRVLAILMLISFAVLSLFANPSQSRDFPAPFTEALESAEDTAGAPEGSLSVDLDMECHGPALTHHQVTNWSGFWLSPREVETIDPRRGESYDSDIVIACGDWPRGQEMGAEAIAGSGYYTYKVWVLPGELQDELEEAGLLVE